MKLPNGDRAIVPEEKLLNFLLNPNHPEQPGHAILFKELLGIGPESADMLRMALLRAAAESEASLGQISPYGQKYEIKFSMTGPRGVYTVLSVWIIESSDVILRLVTAFIE